MGAGFSFQGATGQHYDYVSVNLDNLKAVPWQAGNFVFARSTSSEPIPVYIGEADSIYGAIINQTLWNTARLDHSANTIYVHPRKDTLARQAEQADLVKRYHPPMNAKGSAAEDRR